MNQLLTVGQNVHTAPSQLDLQVIEFLGGGGQGEVYRARLGDQETAVKWFFPHYLKQDGRLRERLESAAQSGPPSDRFLWPTELANAPQTQGFGYLMPLRAPRFAGMVDLVARRVEPSFYALATAGLELAHSYLQLHAKGLCYRDISFGNVFFDPQSGEVRICDNDNVDVDGQPGVIGGTARFMAPEIVRGEAAPSTQTDLFSLAVLLFYLLMNHHPLEGKRESEIRCFDLPAMTRLYGTEPLFIFDPHNDANRPLPGHHDNALAFWPIYPQFLRDLFTRAFTAGVADPHARVRESEWRAALAALRDAILICPNCLAENFYDGEKLRTTRVSGACWSCTQPLQLPLRIRIRRPDGQSVVMLSSNTKLYAHHVDGERAFDFDDEIGVLSQHPNDPQVWGLKNLSNEKWVATTANGTVFDVPPGRSVSLADGTRVQFGHSEGEIRA